ncbi:thymidylate kinase [Piptocephalis cylindrospora]|uniref:Thymidylate kinase n=1 Tax=Piptocephalis cylindrospora TaxID=1907219 RepID=A0A4P9Y633_9FUNG|nr:thymidylate kinase [Piptocephalis cylindrospora]|eukprot:RKP14518.1 thymidylate kinase [Piptocephalis cylindrospora]
MTLAPRRGLFILLEGCDRTGKTTQVALLKEALSKLEHPVTSKRFPDRSTTVGKAIDGYLSSALNLEDRAIHLLFSANRWEAVQEMKRTLMEGTHIIVDRYSASGIAYSVAKGLPLDWCRDPDRGLLRPDLVLLLDQPISIAANRDGWGEERYERVDFQERVRSCFHDLSTHQDWKLIEAARDIPTVHTDILRHVQEAIQRSSDPGPLSFDLWQPASKGK